MQSTDMRIGPVARQTRAALRFPNRWGSRLSYIPRAPGLHRVMSEIGLVRALVWANGDCGISLTGCGSA
jgi:hypothetical protein